jgi:hypothetical protein
MDSNIYYKFMADKQNTELIRQIIVDNNKWSVNDNIRYCPFTGNGTIIIKIPIESLLIDQSENGYNVSIGIDTVSEDEIKSEQLRIYIGSFKKAVNTCNEYNSKKKDFAPKLDVCDFIFNQVIKLPYDLIFTNIFKSKKITTNTYKQKKNKDTKYQHIYFTSEFKLKNIIMGIANIPSVVFEHENKKIIIYALNKYRKQLCLNNNCTIDEKLQTYTYNFCVTRNILLLVKKLYPNYDYKMTILGKRGELNSRLFISFCSYAQIDKLNFNCNVDNIKQDDIRQFDLKEYPFCNIGNNCLTFTIALNRDVYTNNINHDDMYFKAFDCSEIIKEDIQKKEIELQFPATEQYLTWLAAKKIVTVDAKKETRIYANLVYEHSKENLKKKRDTKKREEIQKLVQKHEEQKKLRKKLLEKNKEMIKKEKLQKLQQQKKKEINRQKRLKRKEKLKLKRKEFAEENKKLIEEDFFKKEKLRIQKEKESLLIQEKKKKNIVLDILKSVINKCCREAERKIKKLHKKKLKKFKIKLKNIIFLRYFNNWKNTIIKIKSLEFKQNVPEQQDRLAAEEEEQLEEFIDQKEEEEEMIDQEEEFINYSVTECKWGINCRRPDCYYNHSYGRIIDRWLPPYPEWQWGMPLPFNYPPPPPQLNPFYYCPPVIPTSPNTITYNFHNI